MGALPEQQCLREAFEKVRRLPGVERVILFGSYAKGTQTAESDVDLAVFFRTEKSCLLEEYRCLVRIFAQCGTEVEMQAFSADELTDPCGIIEEIVRFGREVYPADPTVGARN